MDINIDMKTVFISLVAGHLLTVILLSAFRNKHGEDRAVNAFYLAKWAESMAWGTLVFRGSLPEWVAIPLVNSILFLSFSFEMTSLLIVLKEWNTRTKRYILTVTGVSILGFNAIYLLDNVENLRIAFASLATSAFIVLPVFRLFGAKDDRSHLRITVGLGYALVAVGLVGRAVGALSIGNNMSLFNPSLYQVLFGLSLYLIMILKNTGFILLSKEQTEDRLRYMAHHDDLTGIWNRRAFIEQAQRQLEQLARRKQYVTFILFDIDHYKTINDTYGHETGDRVLKSMAHTLQEKLKDVGIFGRYGGDEFVILLAGLNGDEAAEIAERLKSSLQPFMVSGQPVSYTISMGMVTVIADANTRLDSLYQLSDEMLYKAKRNGRNQVARASREPATTT